MKKRTFLRTASLMSVGLATAAPLQMFAKPQSSPKNWNYLLSRLPTLMNAIQAAPTANKSMNNHWGDFCLNHTWSSYHSNFNYVQKTANNFCYVYPFKTKETSFVNASLAFFDKEMNHITNLEGGYLMGLCLLTETLKADKQSSTTIRNKVLPTKILQAGSKNLKEKGTTAYTTNYGQLKIELLGTRFGQAKVKVLLKNKLGMTTLSKTYNYLIG